MKSTDLLELVTLAAIWGMSFLFMRTATPEFGAIALVAVRTSIAALFLLPLLMFKKHLPDLKQHWRPIFWVGLINTAIPFCLFSYAVVQLGAGFGSILNATAPMFAAIVAFFYLKDRLNKWAVLGLLIGFVGVAVISIARSGLNSELAVLSIAAALSATLAYGVAACYTKQRLTGVSTLAVATGSQIFASVMLFPLAYYTWPTDVPSLTAWWQVTVLGTVCTAMAYMLYFRLIANVGAAKAMTVAYLIPVFGVIWGIVFLGESVSLLMAVGAGLILLGVTLTTGVIKIPRSSQSPEG